MTTRHAIVGIVMIFAATTLGCGAAQDAGPKPGQRKGNVDLPFAVDDEELKNTKSNTVVVDVNDIKVPAADLGKPATNDDGVPETDAIDGQMEGLAWGMTYQAVVAIYSDRIKEKYQEDLKLAPGAIEEDRIRTTMLKEINKFKKSYQKFTGKRTGFETTFLADEFTHNNNESMLMFDGGKFVEYFFFFDGRLWKRIRAFRKDAFAENITFGTYIATLEARFGRGQEFFSEMGGLEEIKWQDATSYMSARDQSNFFGVYCLVFISKVTEQNVGKLRKNADIPRGDRLNDGSDDIEKAISGGATGDRNDSVIDNFTGEEPTEDGF